MTNKQMMQQLKPLISIRENIIPLLDSTGFKVNKNYEFEFDKSLKIDSNGYIKQFGTIKNGFEGGDCIGYLQIALNQDFTRVLKYVYIYFFNGTYPIEDKKISQEKKSYELEKIYQKMKLNPIPSGLISKVFDINILRQCKNTQKVLKRYFLYDSINQSLAICIKDEDDKIQAIAIRRAKDKEGNIIKWKTLGSKTYIPHKIKDDIVFIVYGMSEIVLFDMLELSFVAFQSDSVAKSINRHEQFQNEIKPKLKNKIVVLLLENDKSCESTEDYITDEIEDIATVIPLNLQFIHHNSDIKNINKSLPIGYDITDLVNELNDIEKVEKVLEKSIIERNNIEF